PRHGGLRLRDARWAGFPPDGRDPEAGRNDDVREPAPAGRDGREPPDRLGAGARPAEAGAGGVVRAAGSVTRAVREKLWITLPGDVPHPRRILGHPALSRLNPTRYGSTGLAL